ncbi:cilia- and flagella-associated protein 91-like [Drosophila miranda]|uniref:cilia- and flagella-associated protein 91-like n=1 Tax=Drosophila miranda TaxID=7229 RepID=UPI0007E847BF|nr:cilia- and flagella-associated protein 91-like [Drosophila miranda]
MPEQKKRTLRELRGHRVLHDNHQTGPTRFDSAQHLRQPVPQKEQLPSHTKRVTFGNKLGNGGNDQPPKARKGFMQAGKGLTSCLITMSPVGQRLQAGANNPGERSVKRLPRTDSECQFKAPGIDFLTARDTNITTHEIKMRPSATLIGIDSTKCDFFPKYVDKRPFKEQGTQTLYRESSAQTVAYLPEIMDKEMDEHLELFTLPALLPGDKPPGLHEVEILERARKRWAFNKAVKTNFMKQLHEARELTMQTKYKHILEAFEWESWIEREEYIQECQRMRLEIVIKMFDRREKEMHLASKKRIEMACERIEMRRQAGLHKNEIEYQRSKRRLDIQLAKTSRKWQKQSSLYSLGSPCSEFYGPLIRHGVDPARRSFLGTNRKAFDIRMDDLEKRVNMNNVTCPFRKLKEWSKPKEYVKEYEQNFCNDTNLKKLYESLKGLRTQSNMENRTEPKCLKKRKQLTSDKYEKSPSYTHVDFYQAAPKQIQPPEPTQTPGRLPTRRGTLYAKHLESQRRNEAFENLLKTYEGTYIGGIMQFLSEEMGRLKEYRKLHFFTMLAQKERWRREAGEAGLRQKENELRKLYEELFQKSIGAHNQVSNKYLSALLTTDMSHIAESEAALTVTGQAKQIDLDIQRWLESFKLIQTPLTYAPLRLMLRDMVSPDMNAALDRHEKALIANYIVEDVIFGRVWEELEPFDISTTLTSDFIDRLIDNDLYLFSTDSESDTPQKTSSYEAKAIIRKLIRQAVPGQRWKDEIERIVHENQNDLFDDVFAEIMNKIDNPPPVKSSELISVHSCQSQGHISKTDNFRSLYNIDPAMFQNSLPNSELERIQILSLQKKIEKDNVTAGLKSFDKYQGDDNAPEQLDMFIKSEVFNIINDSQENVPEDVFGVTGVLDLSKEKDFKMLKHAKEELEVEVEFHVLPVNFLGDPSSLQDAVFEEEEGIYKEEEDMSDKTDSRAHETPEDFSLPFTSQEGTENVEDEYFPKEEAASVTAETIVANSQIFKFR